MFDGFDPQMIPFFLDLRFHNEKAFMDANRERYLQHVRQPFYDFITELGQMMLKDIVDLEVRPNKCLSRINRDTRFSRDKSPYRDHLWVAFRKAGVEKDGKPFYWFEISPENVSWGMGVWGENRDLFDRMRREMIKSPDAYLKLLELVREADCAVGGAVWKKMVLPEGLPAALGILYPRRSLFFEKQGIDPESIYGPGIVRDVYRDYQRLMPFYRALTRCVEC